MYKKPKSRAGATSGGRSNMMANAPKPKSVSKTLTGTKPKTTTRPKAELPTLKTTSPKKRIAGIKAGYKPSVTRRKPSVSTSTRRQLPARLNPRTGSKETSFGKTPITRTGSKRISTGKTPTRPKAELPTLKTTSPKKKIYTNKQISKSATQARIDELKNSSSKPKSNTWKKPSANASTTAKKRVAQARKKQAAKKTGTSSNVKRKAVSAAEKKYQALVKEYAAYKRKHR